MRHSGREPCPCPEAGLGHLGSAVPFTDGGGSFAHCMNVRALGSEWLDSPSFQLSLSLYFPSRVFTGQAGGLGVPTSLCAPSLGMCVSQAAPAC